MDLIQLIVVIVVMGLIFWAVQAFLPIPAPFKNIVLLILVLITCAWLLSAFGLCSGWSGSHSVHLRNP
jgi:hypothetical protein